MSTLLASTVIAVSFLECCTEAQVEERTATISLDCESSIAFVSVSISGNGNYMVTYPSLAANFAYFICNAFRSARRPTVIGSCSLNLGAGYCVFLSVMAQGSYMGGLTKAGFLVHCRLLIASAFVDFS